MQVLDSLSVTAREKHCTWPVKLTGYIIHWKLRPTLCRAELFEEFNNKHLRQDQISREINNKEGTEAMTQGDFEAKCEYQKES